MEYFLIRFFALLFSGVALAATVPSGVPNITIGNNTLFPAGIGSLSVSSLSTTGGPFTISAGNNQTALTANDFYPFYGTPPGKPITNAAYRVSAGFTAYCFGFTEVANGTGQNWQLVSDTVAISYGQAGALTAGVFQGGATQIYPNPGALVANTPVSFPITWRFGTNTYPGVQVATSSDTAGITAVCYEVQ